MRILNSTHWDSADLARIIRRVASDELDPSHARAFTVHVKYNRGGARGTYTTGCAPIRGNWIRLMIPSGTVDPVDFAGVCAHEFAHARGMGHSEMRGSRRYTRVEGYRDLYGWAADIPIRRKQAPAPPTTEEKRELRRVHALAKVVEWEAKVRRAQAALRKWRRRETAVERQIQIAAQRAQEPKAE